MGYSLFIRFIDEICVTEIPKDPKNLPKAHKTPLL